MPLTQRDFTIEEIHAAQDYIDLRDRSKNPEGKFDKQNRWYPSESEACSCCRSVRSPSVAWPYSYLTHCRTATHVAKRLNVDKNRLIACSVLLLKEGAEEPTD